MHHTCGLASPSRSHNLFEEKKGLFFYPLYLYFFFLLIPFLTLKYKRIQLYFSLFHTLMSSNRIPPGAYIPHLSFFFTKKGFRYLLLFPFLFVHYVLEISFFLIFLTTAFWFTNE